MAEVLTRGRTVVNGTVALGFEPMAAQLARLINDGEERGCAVAAYFEGKPIIDMWAGQANDGPWEADTLGLTYSVTKGPSALCVQLLSDRGAIDVDAPVSRYWPEFAANGKSSTLVKHILNHTAALFTYPNYWHDIGLDRREAANHELVATRLAESPPAWEPGTKPMYHAFTYGNLLDELVRRIDGRSLGRFFRDEIAEPLGLEFWIGLPEELSDRLTLPLADAPLRGRRLTHRRRLLAAAREKIMGGEVFHEVAWPYALLLAHPDLEDPLDLALVGNQAWFHTAELPASNGIGTARALAKIFGMLAEGGEIEGKRIVSREAIRRFSDGNEGRGGGFALGYGLVPPSMKSIGLGAGSFGSGGAGGSLAVADPTNRLSMALTKNQMRDASTAGMRLLLTLYRCLDGSTRAVTIRRNAMEKLISNRRLMSAVTGGMGWLQTFRNPERGFPMGAD